MPLPAGSIYGYSEGDVQALLKELGLEQYAECLKEVDGPTLTELGVDGFKELGIASVVHRSKLAGHVTKLTLEAKSGAEKPAAEKPAAKAVAKTAAAAGYGGSPTKAPPKAVKAATSAFASKDELLAYTSKIRREVEAKEQAAALKAKDPTADVARSSDLTVGEALDEMVASMRSDSFWADLALPIVAAKDELAKETADGRSKAGQLLREAIKQVEELKGFFKEEASTLEKMCNALADAGAPPLTLKMRLDGVRSTRSEGHAQHLAQSPEEMRAKADALRALAFPVLNAFPLNFESDKPWKFEEAVNEPQASVTIKVPPQTKPADIQVTFKQNTLHVAVKDHKLQPVVDGELVGEVDVGACAWTLEGSGEGRKLVLELEKKMGGFMWERLMRD